MIAPSWLLPRPALWLGVGRTTVRAEATQAGAVMWAGEATYADAATLADAVARLAAEAPPRCRRLQVAFESPPAQLRTLADLPPVKPRELRALVAHQASRYFRRNGQPLVTDAVRLGNGRAPAVRAAAIDEPLAEAIAAGARVAGLTLQAIGAAGEEMPLALLPTSERATRERAAHRRQRRLAMAAVTVWLAAGVLFVARLVWERRTVERELAALAQPIAAVLTARRELRDADAAIAAVTAAERLRGRSLAALTAITRALPDSAALTSLAWTASGSGVLSGVARRGAEVVAALDRAGAVAGPRLEGPVVRETVAARSWERFTVVFGGPDHD